MKNLIFALTLAGCMSLYSYGSDIVQHTGTKTGPLNDTVWDVSEWISVADAPVVTGKIKDGMRAADGANWFAATITNEKDVRSAKWMTTALGTYDIYINGQPIGEEVLKPGFTHPDKTKISYTYDITDAFDKKKGESNTLTAQVTPGWWADKIVTPSGHEGMLGNKCAFRGVLEVTYTDGTTKYYGTDTENWQAGIAGKIKHAAIFDGEVYDAREKEGYDCIADFKTPEINTEFKGEIIPTVGAEIYLRHDLALNPIKTYIWEDVSGASDNEYGTVVIKKEYVPCETITLRPNEKLVIDFGQNCAGVPQFKFKAKEGTILKCITSELLNDGNGAKDRGMDGPEGSVHRQNLRIPKEGMYLDYIFNGDEEGEAYTPSHTFFGYRLISVTSDDEVEIYDIKSIPVSSVTEDMEIGTITTGNDMINNLISNTIWGMRSNYLSVPTDCPQRNERLGWTADTQVFAETGTFFADTQGFFHKWLRDMHDSQSPTGSYPGVAPKGQYGNEMSRVGWADAGIIVPWTMWKQFGDTDFIEESWESMEKYMSHINDVKYDHNALKDENGNYQWADWLSYEPLESCSGIGFNSDGPLPETIDYWNFLCASYLIIDAEMMRDMAKATNRDWKRYEQMAEDARDYIRENFVNPDGTFKCEILNTMQTPALFALKNDILDTQAQENVIQRLKNNFCDHGNCLQTGFLGTSILMPVLTDQGMSDIAYELLFQRKNPSWLYSIDNGATTIWERWNSYMIENGMGPKGMNSFNHYAYGCVCQWLWNTAAGIASDPTNPGFNRIIMRPIPDPRLGHLSAEYKSPKGLIKSDWHYDGDTWIWTFTIPEGSTASVTLPGETTSKEYSSGTYTVKK